MHSAEQKQQTERLRAQRIIGVALAVSLLFHGALWGVMRQIPAPQFSPETVFEVTLTPQQRHPKARPTPKTAFKSATKSEMRRTAQQSRRFQANRLRPVRLAALPRTKHSIKHNIRSAQNFSEAAKRPLQNKQPYRPVSAHLNPLRSSVSAPRPDAIESLNANLKALRVAGRGISAASKSTRTTQGNEMASLPQDPTFSETGGQRSGRRRTRDTQLYLRDMGSADSAPPSGESWPTNLRPHSGGNTSNERTANSSFNTGNRLARGSEKIIPLPIFRPAKKLHLTDLSPRAEEAGETVAGNNHARRPRSARRQNRAEEPDLFPTPTPRPLPKNQPETKPEPKTEPELFHPARVRSAPEPPYPTDARRKGQEGTVVVRVQINESGRVTHSSIVSSSGIASLDEAALKAARGRIYEPARRGNTPVADVVKVPFSWSLTD
jgi:TonB family protein